jgi:hypothetical protein
MRENIGFHFQFRRNRWIGGHLKLRMSCLSAQYPNVQVPPWKPPTSRMFTHCSCFGPAQSETLLFSQHSDALTPFNIRFVPPRRSLP